MQILSFQTCILTQSLGNCMHIKCERQWYMPWSPRDPHPIPGFLRWDLYYCLFIPHLLTLQYKQYQSLQLCIISFSIFILKE